jgi:hypothetical protein
MVLLCQLHIHRRNLWRWFHGSKMHQQQKKWERSHYQFAQMQALAHQVRTSHNVNAMSNMHHQMAQPQMQQPQHQARMQADFYSQQYQQPPLQHMAPQSMQPMQPQQMPYQPSPQQPAASQQQFEEELAQLAALNQQMAAAQGLTQQTAAGAYANPGYQQNPMSAQMDPRYSFPMDPTSDDDKSLPRDVLLAKARAYREAQTKRPGQPEQLSMDVQHSENSLEAARRMASEIVKSPFDPRNLEVPTYLRRKQKTAEEGEAEVSQT